MNNPGLNRRQALRRLGASAIGAAASPLWVQELTAFARTQAHADTTAAGMAAEKWVPAVLTARQNDAVVALTELIIPETDTPGAKAAMVNRFIDQVLADAAPRQRDAFLAGLAWIDDRSRSEFGTAFEAAGVQQQTALLTRLADEENHAAGDSAGVEFFHAIKSMTITGYYSTEIGLRQELGDDGQLMLAEFHGCDHPEHQG